MKLTTTTPRRANAEPSYTAGELPPFTNPPPWIQTITGSFFGAGFSGAQTLRYRQSSAGGVPSGAASLGKGSCMQSCAYASALRTPIHGATGCGSRQRRSPTGGAA